MSPSEKAKLDLLALSQKMLVLAEAQDWSQLQAVQQQWERLLPSMLEKYGKEIEVIKPILLENTDQLKQLILASQQHLASELSQTLKQNKSVKKYVKY